MRAVRFVLVVATVSIAAVSAAVAQTSDRALTPLETAVACAPPTSLDIPSGVPHVAGAQDTVSRSLFERRDMLVLEGGSGTGMQLGQKYFIRRPLYTEGDRRHARAIATLGWLSVVAVNDTTALGSMDHMCADVARGDYLEPFVAPSVPAGADRDESAGELDFSTLGRVIAGTENHGAVGVGNLLLIDRGEEQGLQPGARFAVYRDLRTGGIPLSSVGEGVVLSIGKTMSLARLTKSRDAVVAGDYVVPRK
jgi:hypothetical protein